MEAGEQWPCDIGHSQHSHQPGNTIHALRDHRRRHLQKHGWSRELDFGDFRIVRSQCECHRDGPTKSESALCGDELCGRLPQLERRHILDCVEQRLDEFDPGHSRHRAHDRSDYLHALRSGGGLQRRPRVQKLQWNHVDSNRIRHGACFGARCRSGRCEYSHCGHGRWIGCIRREME